jgi:hypothetical protein
MAKIHEAILAIQKNMPQLEKNGVGPQTQGSYKFLSVDDILKATKPLLDKNGVIVHAELLDHGFHYNGALPKDNERVPRESIQAWVKYAFHFIAVEDGSEIVTTVIGEGIDTQDKAVRKATTSAWKISLIQTFSLVTGEIDPDAQDGAYAAQEAPASGGAPSALKKAQGQSGGAKPAANSNNEVGALREQIKAKQQQIADSTGVKPDYGKIGNRIAGNNTWHSDVATLKKVLDALEKGEVE